MTNELFKIEDAEILVKEYKGKRVVTLSDIDMVHERPEGTARRNFSANRNRFINGEDYFIVSADEIRTNRIFTVSDSDHRDKALITETGYLMLVKSLNDDLAWRVQRQLVDGYFRAKNNIIDVNQLPPQMQMFKQLWDMQAQQFIEQQRQAEQLNRIEQRQDMIEDTFQKVSDIENFQRWANTCITKIVESPKFNKGDKKDQKYSYARAESYERLSEKRPCRLDLKVENAKERAKRNTPDITKAELNKINKLYVIANDKDLKPSYELVLKEMMVYYCVNI